MGWPVDHSLSPRIHGFWLNEYRINGAYINLAVSPRNLESALRALPKMGFAGSNLTVPHKEQALSFIDVVDPIAKRIGAVNTITVNDDGSLTGTNTDSYGFIENLRFSVPDWHPRKSPVVVLGAGGASRAVVASLVDAGVPEIRIVNRTISRAEEVAVSIGGPISVYGWNCASDCLSGAGMLVNTTTLGMSGQPSMSIDLRSMRSDAIVTDIVYTPLVTPVLKLAKDHGLKTVSGLGMLLYQAILGFEIWFDQKPVVTEKLRDYMIRNIHERES